MNLTNIFLRLHRKIFLQIIDMMRELILQKTNIFVDCRHIPAHFPHQLPDDEQPKPKEPFPLAGSFL